MLDRSDIQMLDRSDIEIGMKTHFSLKILTDEEI